MRLAWLGVVGLFLSVVAPVRAEEDVDLAKAHFNTGQIYYEKQRFADAAREFDEAYRLSNRPPLLYNVGKSYDGAGDAARALSAYRRFLAAVTASPDRVEVEQRVAALARIVATLQVKCNVDGAAVTVDGVRIGETPLAAPVEINAGPHQIEVAKEGYATARETVRTDVGSSVDLPVDLKSLVKVVQVAAPEAPSRPVYKRWWFWTGVVLVVAGGGAAAAAIGVSSATAISGPYAQLPAVR